MFIHINKEKANLVDVRIGKSNRGNEKHMEDDRKNHGELGTTEK